MSYRDTRSSRQVILKAIPLLLAHVHDEAIAANTDFLATDLVSSDPVVMFRIFVCLDTAALFRAQVDDDVTEVNLDFNAGADLAAQSPYMFDMLVHADDHVNFQANGAVQIEKFIVYEIAWGTM